MGASAPFFYVRGTASDVVVHRTTCVVQRATCAGRGAACGVACGQVRSTGTANEKMGQQNTHFLSTLEATSFGRFSDFWTENQGLLT